MIFHFIDLSHFLIYLLVDGHLDCFYVLASINNDAMNVCITSGVSGSYGNSKFNSMLRNYQTFFLIGCITLYFHQQYMRILMSLYPC